MDSQMNTPPMNAQTQSHRPHDQTDDTGDTPRGKALWTIHLLKKTVQRWQDADASRMAAAISYYTVFSLAPILLVIISLASLLFERQVVRMELLGSLQAVLGSENIGLLRTVLNNMQANSDGSLMASGIGLAVILFGATALFSQLEEILNRIWGEDPDCNPDTEVKGGSVADFVRRRLMSFGIVLIVGLLLLLSLLATTLLSAVGQIWPQMLTTNALLTYLPFINGAGSCSV